MADMTIEMITAFLRDDIAKGLLMDADRIRLQFRKLSMYTTSKVNEGHEGLSSGVPSNHDGTLFLEVRYPHTGGNVTFNVDGSTVDWDLSGSGSRKEVRWCAFR